MLDFYDQVLAQAPGGQKGEVFEQDRRSRGVRFFNVSVGKWAKSVRLPVASDVPRHNSMPPLSCASTRPAAPSVQKTAIGTICGRTDVPEGP